MAGFVMVMQRKEIVVQWWRRRKIGTTGAIILLSSLFVMDAARSATTSKETGDVDAFVVEYEDLVPRTDAMLQNIREARMKGNTGSNREKGLEVRRAIGQLIKKVRYYDQVHRRKLRLQKGDYPERPRVLRLLLACDQMQRVIETEMKVNDFILLALKYDEEWREANRRLQQEQEVVQP